MLAEIYCEKFHQKKIEFFNTLNVVLGTNAGDNSIGKSTFMLIIDFAFGGTTYAKENDILNNIGSHYIYFKFVFNQQCYYFCRNNIDINNVWKCNENRERTELLSLTEYCSWLSKQYGIDLPHLSFRDAVGRYIRAYGKGNYDEKRPLHYVASESENKAIIALLKLFNRYSIIAEIEDQAEKSKEALKVYNKAQALEFVSKIGVREYRRNKTEINRLESEVKDISFGLEYELHDVDADTSEQAIYIKNELSKAKRLRSNLYSKLSTIDENGNYQFSITTDTYEELKKYFPQVDLKHISEIETFHKKISTIFRQELNTERKALLTAIAEYTSIIQRYETQLKELIQNPKLSKIVLQRYADAIKSIEKMRRENDAYVNAEKLKKQKKQEEMRLSNVKNEQLEIIENFLNNKMRSINHLLYKEEYYAPLIHFTDTGYKFHTPNDTGTGIAYKGLVVFDLAILHLTKLPIVVHDSIVLKQISNDAIESIMDQYIASGKQTVIALDKQQSYTQKTSELLEKYAVLKLAPNGDELFGCSWGKRTKE